MEKRRKIIMPNWIKNTLEIKGDKVRILALMDEMKGEDGRFDSVRFIPPIESERYQEEKHYWEDNARRIEDLEVLRIEEDGTLLTIYMESAWVPPCLLVEEMSLRYPELIFLLSSSEVLSCLSSSLLYKDGLSRGYYFTGVDWRGEFHTDGDIEIRGDTQEDEILTEMFNSGNVYGLSHRDYKCIDLFEHRYSHHYVTKYKTENGIGMDFSTHCYGTHEQSKNTCILCSCEAECMAL
jgi:hypothetical protein